MPIEQASGEVSIFGAIAAVGRECLVEAAQPLENFPTNGEMPAVYLER